MSARIEMERRGFIFDGATRLGPAAFSMNFRGKLFGVAAEVSPDFHDTLGMRTVYVRFRIDSSGASALFRHLLDSLTASDGRPGQVRTTAPLPDVAFWGRVTTATLLLTVANDSKTITIAYRAPDPDALVRWRAKDSSSEPRAPDERVYLSVELTEQPKVIYCPKAARHARARGVAKFEFSLTKFGRLTGLVVPMLRQHSSLAAAAEDFLMECAFAPGRINGFPVSSKVSMLIPFDR